MKININKIIIFNFYVLCLFLFSCTGSKRAAIQKEINQAKIISKNESEISKKSEIVKSLKFSEEKIDSTIHSNISDKLKQYKNDLDSFDLSINFIDSIIKSHKLYKANQINLKERLIFVRNYSSNSLKRLRRFQMIDDGLSLAQQYLFNLAAFFGPGKYEIPPEKSEEAQILFTPFLDSLAAFYKKFNDIDKIATIRVLGYADGTGFNKESEIVKTLHTLLNDSLASKEQLNSKLSELRAKKIADLLDMLLASKIVNYTAIQNVDFLILETGKGESFPSKKITDYQENDERRRVVLLFWSILPK